EITFEAKNEPIEVKEIVLWELPAAGARVMGTVDGSPVAAGNMFFAYENPLSKSQLLENVFQCSLGCAVPLRPSQPLRQSAAAGVVPEGQFRRGFLYYLERERAHPYRSFLHYNSWYDIGYRAEKIQPKQFLQVVELFGRELISGRGVRMDSFVLDDGWDNPASLWRFHEGFPNGFAPLKRAVEKYDSVLGAWLSPFGGYGDAKQARLKYGREQGFETNKSGFSLAGPKYYSRFRDACVGMIREYGLNYFKFDGIGTTGRPTGPAPEFVDDMEALMQLIGDLRQAKPDVFINITSGMWTSPFWLWYGDSVWRSGRDWGTHGAGSERRQQVTYRDKETYHNVVKRSPLHPLNSLMTQGVMFANHGLPDEADYLAEDIHAFFASGTNCQELYITPSLLSPHIWDTLAEAAKWSRENMDVLVDTHWVGGDPAEGQIYGWASWSQRKGILSFRNPSDKPGVITIDIGKAFELPRGAAQKYSLKSPWKEDADKAAIVLTAGREHAFKLKPFEVLVFDATGL
ncbi:MAG: alpha-galactosidase, partial [Planctomycetota bacterium]